MILSGCGQEGHGFEGEYKTMINSQHSLGAHRVRTPPTSKVVIGKNFLETNGQKVIVKKIYTQKIQGIEYLIFEDDNKKEQWKIIDKNTLIKGNDPISIKMKRIQ